MIPTHFWDDTDVSGTPVCPFFKLQTVAEELLGLLLKMEPTGCIRNVGK
jgi:hypothetical protein